MTADFLPQFRCHLFSWFEARLADGRTPFRRVEEAPPLLAAGGASPDLVLWINRDSLLAGAVILIPEKTAPDMLQRGAITAAALGLSQFITWEAQAVNLWQLAGAGAILGKSWQLPPAGKLSATDFAVAGDSLLQELKLSAITGRCPPEQLPAEHFANLCLFTLQASQPSLDEAARVTARGALNDHQVTTQALAKGWLTLWRLLALLSYQRLPAGVAPERLEKALTYALADLPLGRSEWLTVTGTESPLPVAAATRFQHLAGRLAQLHWEENRERALATLALLLDEAARCHGVDQAPAGAEPATLLVNRLPETPDENQAVVTPRPCLAGMILLHALSGAPLPAILAEELAQLPQGWTPQRVEASLGETQEPDPAQQRQWFAALRRAWPYRRFTLPGPTPTWVWQALFLTGITAPEGALRLTLPAGWPTAAGAETLWQMLGEQWALAVVEVHPDGRQILDLVPIDLAPPQAAVHIGPGAAIAHRRQLPSTEVPLALLVGLDGDVLPSAPARAARKPLRSAIQERIEAVVFQDGVPCFPEDYLRRRDPVPLCSYQLPGPLRQEGSFFGFCRLLGPQGETLDVDSPVTAEALILVAGSGRRQVSLPKEPLLTAELLKAYQSDLERLWGALLSECRRQLPQQQQAKTMARRIWQGRQLLPVAAAR